MARTRTTTEIEEISDDERIWPEHPLFPLDEGERAFEVSWIHITRIEEGVQKYGPNVPASELLTEQDIITTWGGGHYVIIARANSKTYEGSPGRFTRHRKIHLPGISKPLSPDPTPQEQRISSPQVQPTPSHAMGGMGDPTSFLGMMMQMSQQSLERERQAAEKAAQQNQQFMQMFMAVMQGSKADSQNMMQMMMTMSSQQQQSMLQFITAMMANRGGGPEEVTKYAELINALSGNKDKKGGGEGEGGTSIGAMLENAADLVQGIVQLKGTMGPPPTAPSSELPPGVGGAASLLRGMR